jgi:hypothetical protein
MTRFLFALAMMPDFSIAQIDPTVKADETNLPMPSHCRRSRRTFARVSQERSELLGGGLFSLVIQSGNSIELLHMTSSLLPRWNVGV